MPLENRADHEFAAYVDPQECGQHIAASHQVEPQNPYEIDQHWSLHYHPTEPEPAAEPAGWADGGELGVPAEMLGDLVRMAGLRLVAAASPDREIPERACPHCGGALVMLAPGAYAETMGKARRELMRAVFQYQDLTGDILQNVWPHNPADLTAR